MTSPFCMSRRPSYQKTLVPNESKFTGKERDTETGLDNFGARYYSSSMGRWLSPDWSASAEPVPYADLSNPQSLNLYGYVNNSPMSHTDPDGHECFDDGSCNALRNPASADHWIVNGASNTLSDLLSLDTVAHGSQAAGNSDNSTKDRLIGAGKVVGVAVLDTVGGEIVGKVGGKVLGELVGKVLGEGGGKAGQYLDQKFAQQLERQLSKDGLSSVQKTEKSLQKLVTEHKAKLVDPNLQYKNAIVKQLAKQERQLQTVKEFLKKVPKKD